MSAYRKIEDGQTVFFTSGVPASIGCCDCGLVHEVVLTPTPKGGYIEAKFTRLRRNTAQRRRHILRSASNHEGGGGGGFVDLPTAEEKYNAKLCEPAPEDVR